MCKLFSDDIILHTGAKDMKWGYNKGKSNGKRRAGEKISNPSNAMHENPNYKPLSLEKDAILFLQETGERILDDFFNIKIYKDNRSFGEQLRDPLGFEDKNKKKIEDDQNYSKINRDYWRSQKYKAIRQKLKNLPITETHRETDKDFIENYK